MIKAYSVNTTKLETNTYIVYNTDDDSEKKEVNSEAKGRAVVIDPGGDYEKIIAALDKLNKRCEYVLLTHGHFDHMNAAASFQEAGAKVVCHKNDISKLSTYRSLAHFAGEKLNKVEPDITLVGGEELFLCGMRFKVLYTPGHSEGGVCFIVEDKIFCGDTLFRFSYGRYDFYDGSFSKLKNSIINKLFCLKGDYEMYPGHGEATTLDEERKFNPIKFDTE